MKYLLCLLVFLFSLFSVSAQSHDYTNPSCRYFKCPTGQHCAVQDGAPGCAACKKDFNDEIKARDQEAIIKGEEQKAKEMTENNKRDEELKPIADQQKAKYYVFAFGQKTINAVCGNKVLIKQEEVLLAPNEVDDYENKTEQEIRNTYNSSTGFSNVSVRFISPAYAFICYEGERTYDQNTEGWNCTSTFYGIETGIDLATAEMKFAEMKSEYKKSYFKEIKRRDANELQGVKLESTSTINGVSVVLKKVIKDGSTKVWLAEINNKNTDQIAVVYFLIDGVRYPSNPKKPIKLPSGKTLILNLGKGAIVSTITGTADNIKAEKEGYIHDIKNYIRQDVTEKNGKLEKEKGVSIGGRN